MTILFHLLSIHSELEFPLSVAIHYFLPIHCHQVIIEKLNPVSFVQLCHLYL